MRAGVRHEVIVALAAVVVHVRRPEMAGERLDRLAEVAHQVRVAVVEADADVDAVELVFDQPHERRRRSTAGSGITSSATAR